MTTVAEHASIRKCSDEMSLSGDTIDANTAQNHDAPRTGASDFGCLANCGDPSMFVSAKVTEGLLAYDFELKPRAQLAASWSVSPDSREFTFRLREVCSKGAACVLVENFRKGVAFSNGSHYRSEEADDLLERAAIEADPTTRISLFRAFQERVMQDLPDLTLLAPRQITIASRSIFDHTITADGIAGNLADVRIRA